MGKRVVGEEKLKKKGLVSKIGSLLCYTLIGVFFILIGIAVVSSKSTISKVTFHDLQTNSRANGYEIQNFMDDAFAVGTSLSQYVGENMGNIETNPDEKNATMKSQAYPNIMLTSEQEEIESFLLFIAKNAIKNNDIISGIGIMFEPNAFVAKQESYALYFSRKGEEINIAHVGSYEEEYGQAGYYQIAKDKTDMVFTEPYTYKDVWMVTGAIPMRVNGTLIGVVNIDIAMSEFNKLTANKEVYPSINLSVVAQNGMIIYDTSAKSIGSSMNDSILKDQKTIDTVSEKMKKGQPFEQKYRNEEGKQVYSFFYPLQASTETWQTITTVTVNDVQRSVMRNTVILIIVSIICLIFTIFIITIVLRRVLSPISSVVKAADQIAMGYLDISLEVNTKDEIGELAFAFSKTCASLKNMITDISQILNEIANNNFTVEINTSYSGDFEKIRLSIINITQNLNQVLFNMGTSADQVLEGANQLSNTAQLLADGSTEQASAVEVLFETMHSVTKQVDDNAEHAKNACKLAKNVGIEVEQNNKQMDAISKAMFAISDASKEIELIITSIEEIASLTNLLSLNAAIEAARAGEAGKGFAVVADQVRELANQSAKATSNTKVLIQNSLQAVENGNKIVTIAEDKMKTLVEKIKDVVDTIETISTDSLSQRVAIDSVEQRAKQISEVVQNNCGASQECAAASEELSTQAQSMQNLVNAFQLKK